MKKALLCFLTVSGLLALVPARSSAQDFGFEVSVGPGYYGNGPCVRRYDEDQPAYYYYRPDRYRRYDYDYYYHYRHHYYRPAYAAPYYQGYYHRGHRCHRHEEDED